MFDILHRFIYRFNKVPRDVKNVLGMLKCRTKVRLIANFLLELFFAIPMSVILSPAILFPSTIVIIVSLTCATAFILFCIWFMTKFNGALYIFETEIENILYSKHTRKGKALSEDDFEKLAKSDPNLPRYLTSEKCRGDCYATSLHLLRILKKGSIIFCAIRSTETDNSTCPQLFTMHAMYVNNGWCFDSYSQKQWPLQEALHLLSAKTYRTLSYNEIKGKTYIQIRNEMYPALSKWCKENDCWIKWWLDDE